MDSSSRLTALDDAGTKRDAAFARLHEMLTDHQRRFFVAIVENGVPREAMVSQSGSNQGAIYKTVFDARRKISACPTANGNLEEEPKTAQSATVRGESS